MFPGPARTTSPNALDSNGFQRALIEIENPISACSRVDYNITFFIWGRKTIPLCGAIPMVYVTAFEIAAVTKEIKSRLVWWEFSYIATVAIQRHLLPPPSVTS